MKKNWKNKPLINKILITTFIMLVFFSFLFLLASLIFINSFNQNACIIFSSSSSQNSLNSDLIVFVLMIIFGSIAVLTVIVLLVLLILFYFKNKNKIKIQLDSVETNIPNEVKNVQ